jgi:DNA invertase Pin-like site-specific DNA recombinase
MASLLVCRRVLGVIFGRLGRARLAGGYFKELGMKTALYGRVSTTNGQDPEMQVRELTEFCERRGWEIVQEYVDIGISGGKEKRPELDRLLADAHRRKFDVVVVWRFDRFARSVSQLLKALETFRSLGIEFVSLSEQVDTSTPTGRMVFTVLGAVAELERSLIAERVRAGLRNARAKGRKLGRPRKVLDGVKLTSMRAQGASWRAVGAALGVAPATALHAVAKGRLENPSSKATVSSSKCGGRVTGS